MTRILLALILIRIHCPPADIRMWDRNGEPLAIRWIDGRAAVERIPGSIAIETKDPDCGKFQLRMRAGLRWWRATVECGNGPRYIDLREGM